MNSSLIYQGKALQSKIDQKQRDLEVLRSIHHLQSGIAKVPADGLPHLPPVGVSILTREAEDADDGAFEMEEPAYAFVTNRDITFQKADELWCDFECSLQIHHDELQRLAKELQDLDIQARDLRGVRQLGDGSWVLCNRDGGIEVQRDRYGRVIYEEAVLRRTVFYGRHAFSFGPSPFGLPSPR